VFESDRSPPGAAGRVLTALEMSKSRGPLLIDPFCATCWFLPLPHIREHLSLDSMGGPLKTPLINERSSIRIFIAWPLRAATPYAFVRVLASFGLPSRNLRVESAYGEGELLSISSTVLRGRVSQIMMLKSRL